MTCPDCFERQCRCPQPGRTIDRLLIGFVILAIIGLGGKTMWEWRDMPSRDPGSLTVALEPPKG
jgi:hypothetical protein